ncbi:hypothetical protein BGX26_012369 [Mortierella sp. AD094]|nr:hypothetical protein BGX26_012369 [Mortierella sp. AD094]
MTLPNAKILRTKYVTKGETISETNFRAETTVVDTNLNYGEILVRNLYLSLDLYVSFAFKDPGQGNSRPSTLGKTVTGVGISEVIASKDQAFPVSSIVLSLQAG